MGELGERLIRTFLRDSSGRRPVFGGAEKFQTDPYWRDCILFYEYFHGENGAGIGASHQTGWTGLVARIIQMNAILTRELLAGRDAEANAMRAVAAEPSSDVTSPEMKETSETDPEPELVGAGHWL